MKKLKSILVAALALSGLVAVAQPEFPVAAGSSSGTYKKMLEEINKTFNDMGTNPITFKLVDSHGSTENLDLLVNNKVQGAFLHSDVIYSRAQTDDLSKFKTLLALHKEEVHFLALSTSKTYVTNTTGGTVVFDKRIGGKTTITPITFNTIEDLKGFQVGAAGGGFISANVIRLLSQIPYKVVQFNSGSDVMAALNAGQIEVAVFVGGAPLPNLDNLGREYKILPITTAVSERLRTVYRPATVTYNKMNPNPVPTVAADCLFISREYKTAHLLKPIRDFRNAFYGALDALKETPGNHRKWQEVSAEERGRWPWLELGEPAR